MKRFTIKTGKHNATPLIIQPWVRKITGTAFFVEPEYELGDEDQADWNKLIGIGFSPLKPDLNAIMVAWRYNPDTNKIEVGPYFNVNSERITPERQQPTQKYWINLSKDQPLKFEITYNEVKIWNAITGQFMVVSAPPMNKSFFTSFVINPWFGGNEVAPNTIKLDIDYAFR